MSAFTYQIIRDSNKVSVVKITGLFTDSNQENNANRISVSSLSGALDANNNLLSVTNGTPKPFHKVSVYRVWYDVNIPNGNVRLFWAGASQGTILYLHSNGEYNNAGNWVSIENNASGSGVSGNIGVETIGATNNNSYNIILELHKDNMYFNAGQLTDPASFNYGPFGIKP